MRAFLSSLFLISFFSSFSIANSLKPVKFLAGCWTYENLGRTTQEDWSFDGDTKMKGASTTLVKDKVILREAFSIEFDPKSKTIVYKLARIQPGLKELTLDTKGPTKDSQATFAEPTNKALQKITYTLKDPKTLNVSLHGLQKDGQPFDFNYDMKQDDCKKRKK